MFKYTGIDISKETFDCCIDDGSRVQHVKLKNDFNGFEKLKNLLPPHAHVVMEASGPYYYRLAFFLYRNNIKVSVINPLVIRRFCQMRMTRTKTDKKDAVMIREYALMENPGEWTPDSPVITQLKQLNGAIDLIEKNITAMSNQLSAFKQMPNADTQTLEQMETLLQITINTKLKLEKQMDQVAKKHFNQTYKTLLTIPGIGPKAAVLLIAITGNFEKFNDYRQLVAYIGLNPNIFESGSSVKGKGHISKLGTARLRKVLYLCSWSAKRYNEQCKEMADRLKQKCKPNKVINVAIASKLIRQAFAIGKSGQEYQQNYQPKFAF